jgi:hypothetical protein
MAIVFKRKGDWDGWAKALDNAVRLPDITLGVAVEDQPHATRSPGSSSISNLDIAFINEFGEPASNIPPRPIFGPAMDKNAGRYLAQVRGILKRALRAGGSTANLKREFESLVDDMVADVHHEIANYGHQPELAESTQQRKGHDQPWIETHELEQLIDGFVQVDANFSEGARRFRGALGRFKKVSV